MRIALPFLVLPVLLVAACSGRAPNPDVAEPPRDGAAIVAEARAQFPRTLEMHQRIVARSCAPNTGVCHNTSNYPDLATPGALLQSIDAWCNVEIPDPTQGFDLCEREGDVLVTGGDGVTTFGGFTSEVAFLDRRGRNLWSIGLRVAPETAIVNELAYFYDVHSQPVFQPAPEWRVLVNIKAGEAEGRLTVEGVAEDPFIETYIDEVLASIVGGDLNRNGVFGADHHEESERAVVIAPGSLERSYLWGRITGTVPGSRMPLANQDLSDAEYVAIACFIETLARSVTTPSPTDAIDYDNCAFAANPISYTLLE